MQPKDVVEQFIADTRAHRFDEAKAWLVADGFEYVGPNMHFLSPDAVSYTHLTLPTICSV